MSKLKTLLLFLVTISNLPDSFACGNEYYRKDIPFYNNKLEIKYLLKYSENTTPYWTQGFGEGNGLAEGRYDLIQKIKKAGVSIEEEWRLTWEELQDALNKNVDYKALSDFAWYELRTGNKDNAVKLLEALYAKHPNEYNVLANLGTAYEVTGKNQLALEFLRKAVAINPQSHYGSEWIHIKILEQKVKQNPDYRLILDLKAGNNVADWLFGKGYDKQIKPDSLMIQLAYQLHERISFVAPPDPIVGQLVKDFADLVALTHSEKQAKDFYDYAVQYDSAVLKPINRKVQEKIEKKVEKKKSSIAWLYIGAGFVLLALVAFMLTRRKNKE